MTTSATKIVSSATANNNSNQNNNNNNSNSSNNDIGTSSNNNKIINNNNECVTTDNVKVLKTPVAATTSQIPKEAHNNNINDNVGNIDDVMYKQQQQQQQYVTDFSMKIENNNLSIPIIMTSPGGATKTNNFSTTPNPTTTRAMQSDEDFNIKFVNLVRTHKCLYDKKVPEYRNRDNQEKAWSLISLETQESVIHCKERWRNLRACLSRYIKQQSGTDPQHKPYYLSEYMSFLLPFLKSSRSGSVFQQHNHHHHLLHQNQNYNHNTELNGVNNLSALFQISAATTTTTTTPQNDMHLPAMSVIPLNNNNNNNEVFETRTEVKHSLSENDDEETIDAFDSAIENTLQQQLLFQTRAQMALQYQQQRQQQQQMHQRLSPALSDTASANSMQQFIPDVQLSEAPSAHDAHEYVNNDNSHHLHDNHVGNSISPAPLRHEAKRIKLECNATPINDHHICHCRNNNNNNNPKNNNLATQPDMEFFFRSILPDIENFSAQQKRKFKIGILELIDDVVNKYPAQTTTIPMPMNSNNNNNNNNHRSHRNSTHEKRK